MKKVITITLTFFLVVLVVVTLYLLFLKQDQDSLVGELSDLLPLSPDLDTTNTSNNPNNQVSLIPYTTSSSSPTNLTYKKISQEAIIGPYLLSRNNKEDIVFYVEKQTGHLYQTNREGGIKKLDNQTILDMKEFYLIPSSNGLIYGFLTNKAKVGWKIFPNYDPWSSSSTPVQAQNYQLISNFKALAISPDYTQIFYLITNNQGLDGYIFNLKNKKTEKILSTPIQEWLVSWEANNLITLQTRSSYDTPSLLYSLNPQTKTFTRILSNIKGLTHLVSPDGKKVLYSVSYQNLPYLYLFNLENKSSRKIGLNSLADRCSWKKDNSLIYCAVPKQIPQAKIGRAHV